MNIFKIVLLSFLLISFASCKRDLADSAAKAPAYRSAGKDFTSSAFTPAVPAADIQFGVNQSFLATFSQPVSWKIELIGQTSTAIKTISGTSSVIDATNSLWVGTHDGLYFFESGETVTANLIISGIKGVFKSTTFTLSSAKDSKATTPTFMLVNSNSDFEAPTTNGYPTQFSIFPVGGPYSPNYKLQDDTIRSPEGVRYMRIEGVSAEQNGFFVGGLQCRINGTASAYFFPANWTDPTKLYLNIYVRGADHLPKGNVPYAVLNFECHEDDNKNASTRNNCNYYFNKPASANPDNFCPSSEDSWVFKIPVKHTGWQLFSCKYSDLMPSEDFANGGFGNRKLEPQKVCRVQFGLVSSPPFNRVSADIDFACFTYGAPYDPTK